MEETIAKPLFNSTGTNSLKIVLNDHNFNWGPLLIKNLAVSPKNVPKKLPKVEFPVKDVTNPATAPQITSQM